uniref:hypothetical protein n=1 Tax=Streptomyces sp. IBSBF 2435 TaxID=2903531 RepID=UPI002FDC793B
PHPPPVPADRTAPQLRRLAVPVTRAVPRAARSVMRDALTEAADAGITDPDAATQHIASALMAHGWYVTAEPPPLTAHHPTEQPR